MPTWRFLLFSTLLALAFLLTLTGVVLHTDPVPESDQYGFEYR